MLKNENNNTTLSEKKNGILNKMKRLKRKSVVKKIKTTKCIRYRKKLFFKKKKIKTPSSLSERKSLYSDTSSTEAVENSNDYKNVFLKIIKKISTKFNLESLNINENNINNKINKIISHANSKINIILDIDLTLVYSQRINSNEELLLYNNNKNKNNGYSEDSHLIEFYFENKKYIYNIQVRKGLKEFMIKLLPYCNFYVSTMANSIYIKEVLILLNKKYNLILNNNCLNNVFITHQNEKKTLPPEITKNGNFLILDDNICAWDKTYLSHIIPVKKFYGLYNNTNSTQFDTVYQYYLFTNKIYCFNENKRQFYDCKNKLPFCSEASWTEINQFSNISELIVKSFILNKMVNLPLSFCFYNILNNVLSECKIFYDGEDKIFFQELIQLLGGKFVFDINEASHILINGNNNKEFADKINTNNAKFFYINVKWIFDSFFSFIKCDEEKYKII